MSQTDPWVVHMFGGSSVADPDCFRRVATILEAVPASDPLVGLSPTPSQRATMKYFVVVAALFLVQIVAGEGACAECMVPRPLMEAILSDALGPTSYALDRIVLPAYE